MRPPRNGTLFLAALWMLVYPSISPAELTLSSDPEHVNVRIQGPMVLEGGTPLSLQGMPTGKYRLRANGRGVALTRGHLEVTPEGGLVSSSWAGPDVLFLPPGFAHVLRGDRRRSWIFLGSGLGSSAMALIKGADSRDADAELRLSQLAYDRAQSNEGIALASANLQRASRKAQDTLTIRNWWIGYFATAWLWAATEAWLLTARPQVQATAEDGFLLTVPPASGWPAVWRSTLVPGSGQRYLGRTRRANLFTTGFFLLGAASIFAQEDYMEANRNLSTATERYRAAETPDELQQSGQSLWDASRNVDDKDVIRWVLLGATAGVYLWNILDASTGGTAFTEPTRVGWGVAPQPGGVQAAMSWRLP